MRKIILTLAILYPAAALAQGAAPAEPPTFGGKPLVVVGAKKSAAGKKEKEKPLSVAQKLQACQDIDDATKERLNVTTRFTRRSPSRRHRPQRASMIAASRRRKTSG